MSDFTKIEKIKIDDYVGMIITIDNYIDQNITIEDSQSE